MEQQQTIVTNHTERKCQIYIILKPDGEPDYYLQALNQQLPSKWISSSIRPIAQTRVFDDESAERVCDDNVNQSTIYAWVFRWLFIHLLPHVTGAAVVGRFVRAGRTDSERQLQWIYSVGRACFGLYRIMSIFSRQGRSSKCTIVLALHLNGSTPVRRRSGWEKTISQNEIKRPSAHAKRK